MSLFKENRKRIHVKYEDWIDLDADLNSVSEEYIISMVQKKITEEIKLNLGNIIRKMKIEIHDKEEEHTPINQIKRRKSHFHKIPKIFQYLFQDKKIRKIKSPSRNKYENNSPMFKSKRSNTINLEFDYLNKSPSLYKSLNNDSITSIEENKSYDKENNNSSFTLSNPSGTDKNSLNLLNCDRFKESYESTLCNPVNFLSSNHLSNNYYLSVLFGNICYSIGSFEKAVYFYQSGLGMINKDFFIGNEKINQAILENNIGKAMINNLKVRNGIEYLESSLTKLNSLDTPNSKLLKIIVLFNLAKAYFLVDNHDESIEILEKISDILISYESIIENEEKLKFYYKYYSLIGRIHLRLNNFCYSIENFELSLKYLKTTKENSIDYAEIYNFISLAYDHLQKYEEALDYSQKCLDIYIKVYGKSHAKSLMTYINMSYIYRHMKDSKKALYTLEKTLNIALKSREINHIFNALIYRALGNYYFEIGNEVKGMSNFSKANIYYKKYMAKNDSTIYEINMTIQNMYAMINV